VLRRAHGCDSGTAFATVSGECVWVEIANNTTGSCLWVWETALSGDGLCALDADVSGSCDPGEELNFDPA